MTRKLGEIHMNEPVPTKVEGDVSPVELPKSAPLKDALDLLARKLNEVIAKLNAMNQ
jgi:hypothetical protein